MNRFYFYDDFHCGQVFFCVHLVLIPMHFIPRNGLEKCFGGVIIVIQSVLFLSKIQHKYVIRARNIICWETFTHPLFE